MTVSPVCHLVCCSCAYHKTPFGPKQLSNVFMQVQLQYVPSPPNGVLLEIE